MSESRNWRVVQYGLWINVAVVFEVIGNNKSWGMLLSEDVRRVLAIDGSIDVVRLRWGWWFLWVSENSNTRIGNRGGFQVYLNWWNCFGNLIWRKDAELYSIVECRETSVWARIEEYIDGFWFWGDSLS